MWTWVGAKSTGTSHLNHGTECQDAGVCYQRSWNDSNYLIIVVSDGAGSTSLGGKGARLVTKIMLRNFVRYLSKGKKVSSLCEKQLMHWIDITRAEIGIQSETVGENFKEFGATMVAIIAAKDEYLIAQIGDGGCVVQEECQEAWKMPLWPSRGEYASTTYFVTDMPEPFLRVVKRKKKLNKIAVFTDGIEKLVLDEKNKEPYEEFFNTVFHPLNDNLSSV